MKKYATIRSLEGLGKLGILDPASLLAIGQGAMTVLQQLFPKIFGTSRRRLTDSDWNTLIPGNGEWHNRLRQHLKNTIHYDTDAVNNITPFTADFAARNGLTMQQLQSYLEQEARMAGYSTVPDLPYSDPNVGGTGSFFLSTNTLLLIVGGIALFSLMRSNRR